MTSEIGMWHVAKVAHGAHRELCMVLGDDIPPVWEDLPPWARANALDNVRIQHDNPGIRPADRHWKWVEMRQADGWTYGPKDAEAKTHPCLLPFLALPPPQRVKGEVFGAICEALLPNVR